VTAEEAVEGVERAYEARLEVLTRLGAVGKRHAEYENGDGYVRIVRQFVQKVLQPVFVFL